MSRRNPQLDGLRGLAVLGPVFHHVLEDVPALALAGRLGVALFFVLSGYLITRGLLARRRTWFAFMRRRFARLFPALALALFVGWAWGVPGFGASELAVHALYLSNWHTAARGAWSGFSAHLWSLAIEEQFYAVWPLLVWSSRAPRLLFVVCIAAGVVWGLALTLAAPHAPGLEANLLLAAQVGTPAALPWLGAGALLALDLKVPPLLAAVSVLGTLALLVAGPTPPAFDVIALPAAALLVQRASSESLPWASSAWLGRLGLVSYGVYLFHMLGPVQYGRELVEAGLPLFGAFAALGLSWIAAEVSWRLVEQPAAAALKAAA